MLRKQVEQSKEMTMLREQLEKMNKIQKKKSSEVSPETRKRPSTRNYEHKRHKTLKSESESSEKEFRERERGKKQKVRRSSGSKRWVGNFLERKVIRMKVRIARRIVVTGQRENTILK